VSGVTSILYNIKRLNYIILLGTYLLQYNNIQLDIFYGSPAEEGSNSGSPYQKGWVRGNTGIQSA